MRPTILAWVPALRDQWHIDHFSIGRLVRLSEDSIEGYEEAVAIIMKLDKAVCDDRPIWNRSAWVHTSVTIA